MKTIALAVLLLLGGCLSMEAAKCTVLMTGCYYGP
jgi:hypothetical protein